MFIFLRLMLAHFISDFPLQTKRIYEWKVQSFLGVVLHGLITTVMAAILVAPYLAQIWHYILFIGIAHIIQDWAKVIYWIRPGKDGFWSYAEDQLMHYACIAVAVLMMQAQGIPTEFQSTAFPRPIEFSFSWLSQLVSFGYLSNKVVLYFGGFIAATYFAAITIFMVEKTFLMNVLRSEPPILKNPSLLLSCALITAFVAMKIFALVLVVILAQMAILALNTSNKDPKDPKFFQILAFDILSRTSIAISIGFALQLV